MTTLYVDRKDVTLAYAAGRLALTAEGEPTRHVPTALLDRVVLHARASLDTSVLSGLAQDGVALLVLSPRQGRRIAIVLGTPHNDAAIRVAQVQRLRDEGWRLAWSRRLIDRKIRSSLRLVEHLAAARPDCRYTLTRASTRLASLLPAAVAAADLAQLRGIEGSAAAGYFEGLCAVFPPSLGFAGRNRRPPRDPVNACLSLGYTLAHFEAVRAAYAAGLDPFVGYYHGLSFGRESLACDLVEPLRVHIDGWVWALFRDRRLTDEHFNRDKGACLLGKAGRNTFYREHEDAAGPLRRALRRSAQALARRLRRSIAPADAANVEDDDDDDHGRQAPPQP
jgi:CRISPR-associated protein Cas1